MKERVFNTETLVSTSRTESWVVSPGYSSLGRQGSTSPQLCFGGSQMEKAGVTMWPQPSVADAGPGGVGEGRGWSVHPWWFLQGCCIMPRTHLWVCLNPGCCHLALWTLVFKAEMWMAHSMSMSQTYTGSRDRLAAHDSNFEPPFAPLWNGQKGTFLPDSILVRIYVESSVWPITKALYILQECQIQLYLTWFILKNFFVNQVLHLFWERELVT